MLIPFEILNWFVGFGALVLEVAAVALFLLLFLRKKNETARELSELAYRFGLWIGLLLTTASLTMSLYYSEVLGFEPCGLCWIIRAFSYPMVFLFALALYKGERGIADYITLLAIPGFLTALYQHYLQMGGVELITCPSVSTGADCAERILFEFGHITFPWVAAALFAFLIALMLHVRMRV